VSLKTLMFFAHPYLEILFLKKHSLFKMTEIKQKHNLFNKRANSQLGKFDPANMYSLHDPHDLNHIHGHRRY